MTGMASLAATRLVYGLTEYARGYGFIAAFIAAVTLRHSDRWNPYHGHLETFAEQVERVLLVVIMVCFGGAIARGLLAPLTWQLALVELALVFVIRPLAGAVGLVGMDARRGATERSSASSGSAGSRRSTTSRSL